MRKKISWIYIDWTEREILKPKKRRYRKSYYSWKKKKHTVKNTIITWTWYNILFIWNVHEWRTHDYKMLQKDWIIGYLPWNVPVYTDSAYIWLLKDLIEHGLHMPKKNWKIRKLTEDERLMNTLISSTRVHVEHVIAHLKSFGVLNQKFRQRVYGNYWSVKMNLKQKFLLICAGLQNLKQIC